MSFFLTEAQKAELDALSANAQSAMDNNAPEASQLGLWTEVYERLYSFISEGDGPRDGVDPAVWIWVHGASLVNSGQGFSVIS